jgi:imidazolonepropionase
MRRLIHHNARILTLAGGARRGRDMRDLGVVERGHIVCEDGRIAAVGAGDPPRLDGEHRDAGGRVLMPGFVDCHTHACHAGERYAETAKRLAGVPYLEILAAGGGIMSTVRATRAASADELARGLRARLDAMWRTGTVAAEAKSGYGLDLDTELRMLEAIESVGRERGWPVVPTFLGAHAVDGDEGAYCARTVDEVLPAVVARFGPIACDAYCEKGAWSPAWTRRLFERARSLGCPLRVHVDQFNELGFLDTALELGARSVDHLEATSPAALERVARSDATAVLLPGCGLTLDGRYANGRALVDAGAAVAIATNCNPGSSPVTSMPLVIALAARFCGLTHEEAIVAATANAARVLGIDRDFGSIEPGKRAAVLELPTGDERALAYEWGAAAPIAVHA